MSDAVLIVAITVTGLVALTLGVGAIVHSIIFAVKADIHGVKMQVGEQRVKKPRASASKRRKSNRNK